MSTWRDTLRNWCDTAINLRGAVWGTLAVIASIWIPAMIAIQPVVVPPVIPMVQDAAQHWVVTNAYAIAASNVVVALRTGFGTDLMSEPHIFETILGLQPDSPSVRRASLFHDGAYDLMDVDGNGPIPKAMADACFEIILIQDGTDPAKARACAKAVSLWGFTALRSHTPASVWSAQKFVSVTYRAATSPP